MPRPRPKSPTKPAAKTRVPSAAPFPTLQAFIDSGGHIEIGHVHPIACAAIANDDHNMRVALRRRSGETFVDLLARLDASLKHCLDNEGFIDEINAR